VRGDRQALIVATATYEDPGLRRLRTPATDATALSGVLSDPAIGDFSVEQVIDQPHYKISRALEQFFDKRSLDDVLLVHLSCHGLKDDDGRLYFAAANTERLFPASTAIRSDFLNDLMEHCRARSIILMLDCCYSGAVVRGSKGDEGVHLKEKLSGHGRAILTATNATEYAWEGSDLVGGGEGSVFTSAIVEGLRTGDADRDGDGLVSISDLYGYVEEKVRAERRGQHPRLWALDIQENLYLARSPRRPVAAEEPGAGGAARGRPRNRGEELLRAKKLRTWEALGYKTWEAYCHGEFGLARAQVFRHLHAAAIEEAVSEAAGTPVRLRESYTGTSLGTASLKWPLWCGSASPMLIRRRQPPSPRPRSASSR
jgi:uncharacterized caspase-like protein